eukprot:359241-Chlamydomonas_euryale.AAC.5
MLGPAATARLGMRGVASSGTNDVMATGVSSSAWSGARAVPRHTCAHGQDRAWWPQVCRAAHGRACAPCRATPARIVGITRVPAHCRSHLRRGGVVEDGAGCNVGPASCRCCLDAAGMKRRRPMWQRGFSHMDTLPNRHVAHMHEPPPIYCICAAITPSSLTRTSHRFAHD